MEREEYTQHDIIRLIRRQRDFLFADKTFAEEYARGRVRPTVCKKGVRPEVFDEFGLEKGALTPFKTWTPYVVHKSAPSPAEDRLRTERFGYPCLVYIASQNIDLDGDFFVKHAAPRDSRDWDAGMYIDYDFVNYRYFVGLEPWEFPKITTPSNAERRINTARSRIRPIRVGAAKRSIRL